MCHVFLDVHFYVDVDDITRIMFALNLLPYLIIDGAVIRKWKCHCWFCILFRIEAQYLMSISYVTNTLLDLLYSWNYCVRVTDFQYLLYQ